MTSTTQASIEEQALALTERVMREGRPIAAEQPLSFDPRFAGRRLVIERDGAVVSSLVVLPRTLRIGDREVPIGLIGSVVTEESYRGQGLASELLGRAEDELRLSGAVLSVLWADEREFYAQRGYVPIGTELDYAVPRALAPYLPATDRVRPALEADAQAIHSLYGLHAERVERSIDETRALLAGPGIRALVHEGVQGIDGYALQGRGEDLSGVVHEWGGQADAFLTCLRAHLEELPQGQDSLWWMVPPSQLELQSLMNEAGVEGVLGVLGMGKLLNPAGLARWMNQVTPESIGVEPEGAGVRVTGPAGEIFLSELHSLFAVVPPQANRELLKIVEKTVGAELPQLPQHPFLWGLDSI